VHSKEFTEIYFTRLEEIARLNKLQSETDVRELLASAWKNSGPQRLIDFEEESRNKPCPDGAVNMLMKEVVVRCLDARENLHPMFEDDDKIIKDGNFDVEQTRAFLKNQLNAFYSLFIRNPVHSLIHTILDIPSTSEDLIVCAKLICMGEDLRSSLVYFEEKKLVEEYNARLPEVDRIGKLLAHATRHKFDLERLDGNAFGVMDTQSEIHHYRQVNAQFLDRYKERFYELSIKQKAVENSIEHPHLLRTTSSPPSLKWLNPTP